MTVPIDTTLKSIRKQAMSTQTETMTLFPPILDVRGDLFLQGGVLIRKARDRRLSPLR